MKNTLEGGLRIVGQVGSTWYAAKYEWLCSNIVKVIW